MKTLFGGFAPPAARQATAVFFIVFQLKSWYDNNWIVFLQVKKKVQKQLKPYQYAK